MTKKRPKAKPGAVGARPRKTREGKASTRLTEALSQAARAALAVHHAMPRPRSGVRALDSKPAALLAAAAALKAVTFTNNNFPAVLVSISTYAGSAVLQPGATFRLPSGDHPIAWAAQGTTGAPFQVAVAGGTLDMPIGGVLPAGGNGGPRTLTVA